MAKTHAISMLGLAGTVVEVEAEISSNLPSFVLVGLPDTSLLEAKDRVRSAITNSQLKVPGQRITINLSPASVPKHGSSFDLAIAVAIAVASNQLSFAHLTETLFIGELALDGRLREVDAVLPRVLAAKRAGFKQVVVPAKNRSEALMVSDIDVLAFKNFADLSAGRALDCLPPLSDAEPEAATEELDLAEVRGQATAIEGLTIAAAGGHHILLLGSPGVGKTMLAKRLPTILPALTVEQAIETMAIQSLGGRAFGNLDKQLASLRARPPFESPHHSATDVALIGGGAKTPKPGLISMAHNGVLFLDEATEFSSKTLDALRQPLETREVTIHRAAGTAKFPARFQLLLAANPCPCGYRLSNVNRCSCAHTAATKYLSRLSGPLLDRIDLRLVVQGSRPGVKAASQTSISSAQVREHVANARSVAKQRLASTPWLLNAELPGSILRRDFSGTLSATRKLERLLDSGHLTMRGLDRCLRVAWTIADLADSGPPGEADVDMALMFRGKEVLSERL